jgi:hypothetical protein
MSLMEDRSPRTGTERSDAVKLALQPLEGANLLHWVGSPSASPALEFPGPEFGPEFSGLGFCVALIIGVNTHQSAIMRPPPSRTIAMAASRLNFKSTKTPASRAANTAAYTSRRTDESRPHQTLSDHGHETRTPPNFSGALILGEFDWYPSADRGQPGSGFKIACCRRSATIMDSKIQTASAFAPIEPLSGVGKLWRKALNHREISCHE